MYRAAEIGGDAIQVPQLVFSKLGAPGATDARFRVALYVIGRREAAAEEVARALHIKQAEAESALAFWEGAGLLVKIAAPQTAAPPLAVRRRLTTREVTQAGSNDPMLGQMVEELQRIFGGVVSPSDINILVTLYVVDGLPPDLILLAASHFAARGVYSARYLEKTLRAWQRDGIQDYAGAEQYLQMLAKREKREAEVAKMLAMPKEAFTLAERKRIALWYEEYGYDKRMIEAARLAAGEKQNEVLYLAGILKKWYGKGYKNPRDIQQNEENRNLRVQGGQKPNTDATNILGSMTEYVPRKQRRNTP